MFAVQEACNASVLPYAALPTLRVDPGPPAQPLLDLLPRGETRKASPPYSRIAPADFAHVSYMSKVPVTRALLVSLPISVSRVLLDGTYVQY